MSLQVPNIALHGPTLGWYDAAAYLCAFNASARIAHHGLVATGLDRQPHGLNYELHYAPVHGYWWWNADDWITFVLHFLEEYVKPSLYDDKYERGVDPGTLPSLFLLMQKYS